MELRLHIFRFRIMIERDNWLDEIEQNPRYSALNKKQRAKLAEMLTHLRSVRSTNNGFAACCPAHEDHDPSLSIGIKDGKVLLHCYAGCEYLDILQALNLSPNCLGNVPSIRPSATHPMSNFNRSTANPELEQEYQRLKQNSQDNDLEILADDLGVTVGSLTRLGCVAVDESNWVFPEYNAEGRICGLLNRDANGDKKARKDSKRGLYLPNDWDCQTHREDSPLLICEGASDTAAALSNGHRAIGRPCMQGGKEDLAILLRTFKHPIIIVADNDSSGHGVEDATKLAEFLSQRLRKAIDVVIPKDGKKDVRELCNQLMENGEDV